MCSRLAHRPSAAVYRRGHPMLTRKQQELLLFINHRLSEGGVSPSFDEMKDALNLRSKSGIHRLITGLEERGFIRRLPHRARALGGASPAGWHRYRRRDRGATRPALRAQCHQGRFQRRHAGPRRRRPRGGGGGVPAAIWSDRRRHADRGTARPFAIRRRAGDPAWQRRSLCARGCRRQHDRCRHL